MAKSIYKQSILQLEAACRRVEKASTYLVIDDPKMSSEIGQIKKSIDDAIKKCNAKSQEG